MRDETQICEAGIVLEICPTSNLLTKALESEEFELRLRIGALEEERLGEANRRGHEASFVQLLALRPARRARASCAVTTLPLGSLSSAACRKTGMASASRPPRRKTSASAIRT
jgi:hypothetical protein